MTERESPSTSKRFPLVGVARNLMRVLDEIAGRLGYRRGVRPMALKPLYMFKAGDVRLSGATAQLVELAEEAGFELIVTRDDGSRTSFEIRMLFWMSHDRARELLREIVLKMAIIDGPPN